ncbi:MAG: DUF2141 domain-containing protein [Chlorobi bacterium]|nr:DUF2141 domain-containing protein [Chlorobiota bacterium]
MGSKAIWVIALLTVGFVIINGGCANVVPPSGGPRDLQPPKVVEVVPSCGEQPQREITIVFNEPILVHQQGKIFLQPAKEFKYKVKRNKLHIFIDSLADSAFLYLSLVNFVKDITEGNILKSFSCLWHSYDTLYKPKISVLQMPFPKRVLKFVVLLRDSTGRELMYYSHDGSLPDLPVGRYAITVWEDENNNLKLDLNERVGTKHIRIPQEGKDTILISSQSPRISVRTISPLSAQLIVNIGGWDSISLPLSFVRVGDTIVAALPGSQRQINIRFYGSYDTTIVVVIPAKRDSVSNIVIPKSFLKQDTALFSFVPIIFPAPVSNRKDSLIAITTDSVIRLPVFWVSPIKAFVFLEKSKSYLIPNQQFKLEWGRLKNDSIKIITDRWTRCSAFTTGNKNNNPALIKSDKISLWLSPQSQILSFECFPAISITIYKLHDRNNDRRWNNGNYKKFIPPERMEKVKTIKLEPGWEHKEIIK